MLLPTIFPVTCHTDRVGPGSTFVAIKGFSHNGTSFIPLALEKGAVKIIIHDDDVTPEIVDLCRQHNATLQFTTDTRKALAQESSNALANPASKLKIVGITGTKGKSTTAFLIEHILQTAGYKTALISTIRNSIGDQSEPSMLTTPSSDYFQMFLAACVTNKVEYVVMEVSAHALSLDRVHTVSFDAIGFTNLAPEHLDFYSDMQQYFNAKATLFSHIKQHGIIAINADNEWAQLAYQSATVQADKQGANVVTFSTNAQPAYSTHHYPIAIHQASCDGIELALAMRPTLFVECKALFGTFNCYNIAMAILLTHHLGVNYTALIRALRTFKGVPGRLQRHQLASGALAFVDYAHNPSSFKEVLSTLRPYTNHLIVVFGCGGNRDSTKRPVMGALACHYADQIIITDDNPRFENNLAIIADIQHGVPADAKNKTICIPDRAQAIIHAASLAKHDSIIALLGKGHETYYSTNGVKHHFDDFEQISKF